MRAGTRTVSNAMATGRLSGLAIGRWWARYQRPVRKGTRRSEDAPASIALVLSMTLWWYSYDPWEKFMRTVQFAQHEKKITSQYPRKWSDTGRTDQC